MVKLFTQLPTERDTDKNDDRARLRSRAERPFVSIDAGRLCDARLAAAPKCATLIAEKVDGAGRHVRQIELCAQHCGVVIDRERTRGLEISDWRDE